MRFKNCHHAGEVQQAAAQSIDFVNDHAINTASLEIIQQPSQRGTFGIGAGER